MSSPAWGGGGNLTRTWYNPTWGKSSDGVEMGWSTNSSHGEFQCIFDAGNGFTPVAAANSIIECASLGPHPPNDFGGGENMQGGFLDFNGSGGSEVRLVLYGGENQIHDGDFDWRVYWPFSVVTGYNNVIFNLMGVQSFHSGKDALANHTIQGGPVANAARTHVSIPAAGELRAVNPQGGRDQTILGLNPYLSDASKMRLRYAANRVNSGYLNYVPLFLGEY